ncbi:response regulator transcription factor [Dactylosporangium sp. AC04546]|uniref:response regulator n=1 Tax=Dactylosporangium sp. AC04546 TaxID=2862460 RepID=UPI001EDCB224|nr:response regulator transcription factor [Dactylosporangium sp. AC04546]WVK81929.1 response regulator transcription factor [Dactylosporangium sp. AC04546]
MADVIRLLIVDDDPLVRAGLGMVLGGDPTLDLVGEAGDGAAAVTAARSLHPDVVLMDIRMPRMDGLAALEALQAAGSAPAVIMLTTFDTDDFVLRALRHGAHGFLLKDTPPRAILDAVRRVAAGEQMLSPSVVRRLIAHVVHDEAGERRRAAARALEALTPRERDVAGAVAEGGSNAEISAALHMSVATVKTYVSRILAKLGCTNRVQVAILVHEARLSGGSGPR